MIEVMQFLVWEISTLLFGLGVAFWVTGGRRRAYTHDGLFLTCALGLKLWLCGWIPQTAAFFSGSTTWLLLGSALVSATIGVLCYRYTVQTCNSLLPSLPVTGDGDIELAVSLAAIALIGLALPIAGSFMPLLESDSMTYSPAILGMANGSVKPIDFPNHYAALWESAYIPGFLLSQSSYYFAYTSLQASLLLSCASFLVARQLGLGAAFSVLLAIAALFSGHLWGTQPTGANTLKNDIITAAGLVCAVAGALRWGQTGTIAKPAAVLLGIGAAFAFSKSSGPILMLLTLGCCSVLWFRNIRQTAKQTAGTLILIVLFVMLSSGFYYAWNWYAYGNPVFPFSIALGPIGFTGPLDLSGTRLIDHVGSLQAWVYFFGLDQLFRNKVGTLFPVIFLLANLICPLVILFSRFFQGQRRLFLLVWFVVSISWFFFFGTPWSAGTTPKDFFYISNQSSLRYVIGALELSLILVAAVLFRLGRIGPWLAWTFVGLELIARIHALYRFTGLGDYSSIFDWSAPIWPAGTAWVSLGVLCAILMLMLPRRRAFVSVMAFFGCGVFLVPHTFQANKAYWGGDFLAVDLLHGERNQGNAYNLMWSKEDPALSTTLISDALATMGSNWTFQFKGELVPADLERARSKQNIAALVARASGNPLSEADLRTMDARLYPLGFSLVRSAPSSAVFLNMQVSHFASERIDGPVPLMERLPTCVLTGQDCPFSIPQDSVFATQSPAGLWRWKAQHLTRISVPDRSVITLTHFPDTNQKGSFEYTLSGGWAMTESVYADIVKRQSLPPLLDSGQLNAAAWGVASPKPIKQSVEQVDGHPMLVIHALEDTPWIAVALKGEASDGSEHLIYGRVGSDRDLEVHFQAFDFQGDAKPGYTLHPIHVPAGKEADAWMGFKFGSDRSRDYAAITAVNLKAGQILMIKDALAISTLWPKELFEKLTQNTKHGT